MNIQPLPGYKKPANIDSIRRPKKRSIEDTEKPAKPEPHSAELDAALNAVSQLNADLDSNKGASETQQAKPEPRRIDDIMSTQPVVNALSAPTTKPRLDDADMTGNIKSENSVRSAGQPASPTDEASLAEIEKNIAKAVEDDLGIKRPTVRPVKPDNDATQNSARGDNNDKHDNPEATPAEPVPSTVAPKPPKPRKMQSLFSVSDFAKPEPKFDDSNFSMDSNTVSDEDILTASIPSSASNSYASPVSNAGTSIDGIRKSASDAKRLDDRQNQLLSDMGYGSESNELPVRQERPSSHSATNS